MNPVEVVPAPGGTLVLRARGSELLILPSHIIELKKLSGSQEFTTYFLRDALINRPARKLFEAWLRKDQGLWKRLYQTIHKEINIEDAEAAVAAMNEAQNVAEDKPAAPVKKKTEETPAKKAEPKKEAPAKKAEAKKEAPVKKAEPKKEAAKPAKKVTKAKATEKAETKPTTKKKATKSSSTGTAKKKTVTKKVAVKKTAKKKTTKK